MKIKAASLLATVFTLCIASEANPVKPQSGDSYKNRGDRCEGRKESSQNAGNESPVFELISARVEYNDESLTSLPEKLKVAFYSSQQSTAYLVVREIKPKHSYWMTRTSKCKDGFGNVFEWLTQPFLAKWGDLTMYELGVVVRLNEPKPGAEDIIAPAIFYHRKSAKNASKYRFIFMSTVNAEVELALYRANEKKVKDLTQGKVRIKIGTPLSIQVDLSLHKSGDFQLKGDVIYKKDEKTLIKLPQNIKFHHELDVPDLNKIEPMRTLTTGRCL
ncbi:MAG: hypothetical protein ACREEM_00655 [Blastocatellia bacterium]